MAKPYKNEWEGAIKAGDLDVATRLVSTTDINEVFVASGSWHETWLNKTTPLKFAVKHGERKIVELLVKSKADINQATHGSFPRPLDQAAVGDDVGLLRFLVENKADVNLKNQSERLPPLERAAEEGKIANVIALLGYGAEAEPKVVQAVLVKCCVQAQARSGPIESIISYLNISKIFIRLYKKYSLDGSHITPLNHAMKILVDIKPWGSKAWQAKELVAEVLMLMANSPSMNDYVVKKTIRYAVMYTFCKPKISDTYMQVLQEHPSWAIYNAALIEKLSPEAQALNQQNFERGVAATKAEIASRLDLVPYMPKAVREFILSFMSDADLIDAHCFARDIAHIPQAMEEPAPSAAAAIGSAVAPQPEQDIAELIGGDS